VLPEYQRQGIGDHVRSLVGGGDGARPHLHAVVRAAVRRASDARDGSRRLQATLEMKAGVISVEREGDTWTLRAKQPTSREASSPNVESRTRRA
jgi:hypothetical protein